jgi:hypothetical protein
MKGSLSSSVTQEKKPKDNNELGGSSLSSATQEKN